QPRGAPPAAVPPAARRPRGPPCGPPEAAFRTSGTTAGAAARGHPLVPHLALYRASALAAFARLVLPDGLRLPALFLVPPPALRPDSSLVQMCAWVGEAFAPATEWLGGPAGAALPAAPA